jgi:hypothetical protein
MGDAAETATMAATATAADVSLTVGPVRVTVSSPQKSRTSALAALPSPSQLPYGGAVGVYGGAPIESGSSDTASVEVRAGATTVTVQSPARRAATAVPVHGVVHAIDVGAAAGWETEAVVYQRVPESPRSVMAREDAEARAVIDAFFGSELATIRMTWKSDLGMSN